MEAKILVAVRFDLSHPHPIVFFRWYTKGMKFEAKRLHMAKFLMEMALLGSTLSLILPSRTACVCVIIASKLCDTAHGSNTMRYVLIGLWRRRRVTG
ncbi:hypothetical protein KIN20_024669 [Parelaphostrongylus tenuis]|uniref:Cyclin C-terminal domain-containing protein n=1 Tax=Parelaphostrongylus tenuis TaxID=148309 RepID=A0AAD5NA59_PARTN|nr:hypothetical protein KIN20_024669 [Parelaphostrongylus tenuis]